MNDAKSTFGGWYDDDTYDPWAEPNEEPDATPNPDVRSVMAEALCATSHLSYWDERADAVLDALSASGYVVVKELVLRG